MVEYDAKRKEDQQTPNKTELREMQALFFTHFFPTKLGFGGKLMSVSPWLPI